MAGMDLALAAETVSRGMGMERLERLLAGHNIRLAPGRSRCTGQAVIRIVDARTGRSAMHLPQGIGHELAGLAEDLARRGGAPRLS